MPPRRTSPHALGPTPDDDDRDEPTDELLDDDDSDDEADLDDDADEDVEDEDVDDAAEDDDPDLDDEFPLGDGAADSAAVAACPYCGEPVEVLLDAGGGDAQEYVEDCEVCCRPWRVTVRYRRDGTADVHLQGLDD